MTKSFLSITLLLLSFLGYGQCVDFNAPTDVCINQNFEIENISTEASFEWDFCTGDYFSTPAASNAGTINGIGDNRGIDIVYDGANWYGFATGRSSNNVVRLDFGIDLLNSPVSTDLGNVDGLLDGPEPIKIIEENNQWYGFIHNGGGKTLVRLDFGSSLSNTPSASTVLSSVGGTGTKFDVGYTNDSLVLVMMNFSGSSSMTIVNFGNSVTNLPGPSDYFTTPALSPASWTSSISLIRQCDNWYGVSENLFNGRAYVFSFGSSLFNTPTAVEVGTNVYGSDDPTRSWIVRDNNEYIIHTTTSNGNLYKLDIGADLSAPTIVSSANLGKLSQLSKTYSLTFASVNSTRYAFTTDRLSGKLVRLDFANLCDNAVEYSTDFEPGVISYSSSDNYYVGFKAIDDNGQPIDNIFKQITVSPSTAPDIDFTPSLPISCVNNAIDFTAINNSADVQSYDWDFGDGNTFSTTNPAINYTSHAYAAPGTYNIKLSVTAANACDNFVEKSITIYNEPVSSFDSPSGVVCTNQPITFTNTTPDIFEGNETFEWMVDGVSVSTDRDLAYEFTSGGMHEVKLITSIPGCTQETTDNITIIAGPAPNFTVTDNCVGTLFEFNNTSTGSNIVSYAWDFDNGFMSSEENPAPFEYSQAGAYNVTLTTENASGCVTSIEKALTVYDLPKVKFAHELSCEEAITQFADSSTVSDANIEAWQWSFDDPNSGNNTSTARHATHIFSSDGDFDVKLITTSTFGCIDSTEQIVQVKTAPEADFTYGKVCLGEEVNFQDASLPVPGEELTAWAWNIGGEFSDQQSPTASLDFPIDYNVSLTVTSQNLCTNTIEKTITVNPTPEIDFETESACENQKVHFYDMSVPAGDPIASRAWDFDGLATAADSSVYFKFTKAGNFNIALAITTAGGCEYSLQKTVTVNEAPQADFDISSAYGAPPFTVEFTNHSSSAVDYLWDFADGNSSVATNPVNTFEEAGTYEVTLAIRDANGCADTTSAIVNALVPNLDIELRQLTVVGDQLVLTIINNGTIAVDSMLATANLGDEIVLEEVVKQPLLPSANPKAVNHTLALKLIDNNVDYICVTLTSFLENIEDSEPINNSKCKNTDTPVIFINPFPNPVRDVLNVIVVSERTGSGMIKLTNSIGETVREVTFDGVKGRNQIEVSTSDIQGGLYLMQVEMAGSTFTSRVAIDN